MASPQPLTYFQGNTSVGATAASLYSLILAYFVANRPGDLGIDGQLTYRAYRLINIVVTSGVINYGDYTVSTTVGVPITAGGAKYEQSYSDVQSIDINSRYLCSTTGTQTFSFECWR